MQEMRKNHDSMIMEVKKVHTTQLEEKDKQISEMKKGGRLSYQ